MALKNSVIRWFQKYFFRENIFFKERFLLWFKFFDCLFLTGPINGKATNPSSQFALIFFYRKWRNWSKSQGRNKAWLNPFFDKLETRIYNLSFFGQKNSFLKHKIYLFKNWKINIYEYLKTFHERQKIMSEKAAYLRCLKSPIYF